MIVEVLDDATYSSGGDPEPLSNDVLSMKGGLCEDMLFGNIWDVVPVPHEL